MFSILMTLSRPAKQALFLTADTLLAPLSLYAAFALRFGTAMPLPLIDQSWALLPVMAALAAATSSFCGLHRIKLKSIETRAIMQIGLCALILAGLASAASYLLDLAAPRSVPLIFGAVFFLAAVAVRLMALQIMGLVEHRGGDRAPVIIYGAGSAGIQLASALKQSSEAKAVAFVDDNSHLHGLMIAGLPVHSPKILTALIAKKSVRRILFALPSASMERQSELVQSLTHVKIEVQILPSYIEMMTGQGIEASLRPVSPDALLGRAKVALDSPEIARAYAGRTVMVTGAGGSIGSELCRQLILCKPSDIVLFERSEIALYSIDREIRALTAGTGITVHTVLGSVTDAMRVKAVIRQYGISTILHAAAYKHVPLVEANEIEGARNNILGTRILAEAAAEARVARFILISTDKAVRPTNIMGATKRLAELVLQDIQTRHPDTKFSMVRFGNVLGSSGSVLPLFQKQIAAGGPVTVTHRDVTRFFMTIPEASRLVLLAGSFATGGDVFVLDMGKPRKIIDIARQMILLSGRRIKEPGSPDGDIEIKVVGLRPGEKLYEELLISGDSLIGTPHEKILRAEEGKLSELEVALMLRDLSNAIAGNDPTLIRKLVTKWVDGYHQPEREAVIA